MLLLAFQMQYITMLVCQYVRACVLHHDAADSMLHAVYDDAAVDVW